MTTVRNEDVHTRVWIGLQRPDGRTLELEPAEECDLDLPSDFVDAHLTVVTRSKPKRDAGSPPDATENDEAPASDKES